MNKNNKNSDIDSLFSEVIVEFGYSKENAMTIQSSIPLEDRLSMWERYYESMLNEDYSYSSSVFAGLSVIIYTFTFIASVFSYAFDKIDMKIFGIVLLLIFLLSIVVFFICPYMISQKRKAAHDEYSKTIIKKILLKNNLLPVPVNVTLPPCDDSEKIEKENEE